MKTTTLMGAAIVAFGLSLFGWSGSAEAQESPETSYNFEDELVGGDLVNPLGEILNVRRRGARDSLIRVREHFIPEMLKSVENL